jgi:putative Mg2+ transporter-C (MgtC) family protein
MWDSIAATLASEFHDLRDIGQLVQVVLRLAMAALLGGVIGFEREVRGKAAGIRTHMLATLAAALAVLVPMQAGLGQEALSRVVQGLFAGVGLLCAGSILKSSDEESIRGLTTAAGLWMTTAIGIACGMGRLSTALLATALAMAILELEHPVKRAVRRRRRRAGLPPSEHG